jgi:hypothetical protein
MQRITDPTAVASLPPPPALTGTTGYFGPAVPGISAATRFRFWVANMWQEEMMSLLAAAGIAADTTGTVFNQVLLSVQALIGAVPHGVQAITASGNFVVPVGVTAIDVELWAGGSGSWASVPGCTGGGGSGGGYARKRIIGLATGAIIPVTIGAGGAAGVSGTSAPGSGGASQFGSGGAIYCSASGGTCNPIGSVSAPMLGNQGGVGSGGDLNLYGGDGGCGQANQGGLVFNNGGMGGSGPLSGGMEGSGTTGVPGRFPGGGASGAGTGAAGTTSYAAAAGAAGLCMVRW